MLLLVLSTLLKIAFVLVLILAIAPVLVWAERRQSAMIQDRVGPVRAGLPLPGYQALVGVGVLNFMGAWSASVGVTALMYWFDVITGDQLAVGVIPAFGPFALAINLLPQGIGYPLLLSILGVGHLAGIGLFLFALATKMSCADFIKGPATKGAQATAAAAGVFAALSILGGIWFELGMSDEATSTSVMSTGTYFLIAFLSGVVAVAHVAIAWLVHNSVDKRGHLVAFGHLHPIADVVKMIWKEDFEPTGADRFLYTIAPVIALVPAFATFAVIPFGPELLWGPEGDAFKYLFTVTPAGAAIDDARMIPLQVASVNVGILYIFAIAGTGIIGAAIAGYSSNNKYSLLGGIRAASQMVSYEVTLGLTLVGCFMIYNTLLLDDMVAWQEQHVWGFIAQPLALILFFFCTIAEMKRNPFDAPEGESEIVAGYFLEYAGLKFGMFMTGEFVEHVVSSGLIVTIFFGGYHIPLLHHDGFHFGDVIGYDILLPHVVVVLLGVGAFVLKMVVIMFLMLQVRWTLPRFRYDQIMQLCWKIILPLSLANILVTGFVILMLGG